MEEYGTGLLSEHESSPKEGASKQYQPTPEERKTLKTIDKIFSKSKSHRHRYDKNWLKYYKFYRGKQWTEQRPAYRHADVYNFVMQTIRSQVPIISDARQKFEYLPENPMDREFADIINEIAEADWQKNNWSMVLTENLYDSHIYGTALGTVVNDPSLKTGVSGIVFKSADPFYSFPDPNATDVNVNSNSFIYAEPVDVEVLKREYPDKAAYIKPDLIDIMHGDKTELGPMRFRSPTDLKVAGEGDAANDVLQKDQALKMTCYIHDDEYTEEENQESDPISGEMKLSYIQKKKYPNGRKICRVNNIILEDGPLGFDDGLFPYAKLVNGVLPREFWGISEVEPLEGPQVIFNKVMSFTMDVMTLMGNPIWVVPTNAEIDTDNLFNRPGLIVEPAPGVDVHRLEGVQLQPYVLEVADKVRSYIDSISGANDVTRGVRPDGITAASAIAQLQDAANTRSREKSRFLDAYLQNIGQMYLSRLLQFTPAPRIVRITDNQNASKYFKFHVETVKDEQGNDQLDASGNPVKVAKVRNFIQNYQTGEISEDPTENEYQIRGRFDVRVSTGSSLGFEKDRKFNQAQVLFDRGALDEVELLKAADWPDWESTWEKVKERKIEMAKQMPQQPAKG